MLTGSHTGVFSVLAALVGMVIVTAPAPRAAAATCTEEHSGAVIDVPCETEPSTPPSTPPSPGTDEEDPPAPERTCKRGSTKVPCFNEHLGVWHDALNCYQSVMTPPPPKDDAVWEGHDEGVIVNCVKNDAQCEEADSLYCMDQSWWAAEPPEGLGLPDGEALAREAVASMRLSKIDIGIVPEDKPDRIGLVGLPVWMWVESPDARSMGPITRSASDGDYTIEVTGEVDRVEWDMGDGTVVTCTGPGTPYEDVYDMNPSPDCGHTYTRQGEYEVTATSYWNIEWSGFGQSGELPADFTSSTTILIGEAQVLTQ